MFKDYKETSWPIIIGVVLVFVLLNFIWLNPLKPFALFIGEVTGGVIHPTLVIGLTDFVLIVGGLVIFTNLRWRDFGLKAASLLPAIVLILGLWLLMNVGLLILALIQGSEISFANDWQTTGIIAVFGILISQLFGNALIEESLFRGFLIPQLFLKLKGVGDNPFPRGLIYAVILSLVVFTLQHLMNLSNTGIGSVLQTMFGIFLVGGLFTVFYLRTKNLFLTIGFHALNNAPTPIFQSTEAGAQGTMIVLGILLLLLWSYLPKSLNQSR